MLAAYYQRYGKPEVLTVGEQPAPVRRAGAVLVRVRAAALNPKDILVRKGRFKIVTGPAWAPGTFPRIPGYDFAGEVLESNDETLPAGAAVYGMVNAWRGGCSAQLVSCPRSELARAPRSVSVAEAAATPLAALTALQALRDLLDLREGNRVLLNGASGGVGLFAVQIARILGAEVTAICSGRNEALVREYGAGEVRPYDQGSPFEGRGDFDAVFDIFGTAPYPEVAGLLGHRGRYATAIPRADTALRDIATRFTRRPARLVVVKSQRDHLEQIAGWIDGGKLRPVVDRVLPLAEVAEAHRYIETRRARGKVVLEIPE